MRQCGKNIVQPDKHEHCILGTKDHKHIIGTCNTYFFPLQQCLHERDSLSHFTYIAFLVNFEIFTRKIIA